MSLYPSEGWFREKYGDEVTVMNNKIAAIAAYYMARFNSNLGCPTAIQAFDLVSAKTGVDAGTVKTGMRDTFDGLFPWRKGWDLRHDDANRLWERYGLEDVFVALNPLSQSEVGMMLKVLGVWGESIE